MIPTSLKKPVLSATQVKKPRFATKLNLVALMDIFTILVFFLLLNTGDADRLQNAKFVSLPDSSATADAHGEALIVIGEEEIWFNNESVIMIEDLAESKEKQIAPLAEALKLFATERGEASSYEKENGLAVTIMGDKSVSFSLLERVMSTCSMENYRDISLAVNRVAARQIATDSLTPMSEVKLGSLGR